MAEKGGVNTNIFRGFANSISTGFRNIMNLGINYGDQAVQQSRAIGALEAEFMQYGTGYNDMYSWFQSGGADIYSKEFIAYFEQQYPAQREYLRKFAINSEIDFMVETVADEAIVYDDDNYFARPSTEQVSVHYKSDEATKIIEDINSTFNDIYHIFNFKTSHDGFHYFKKLLIDGFLTFEIIWNKEGEKIIGFKEMDVTSIRPDIRDGKRIWIQYENVPGMTRILSDQQVIYISSSRTNFVGHISYVERMVRSFNLLRIVENSRIIWNIMNASYRIKMIIPTGRSSRTQQQQTLGEFLGAYREDIDINMDSGEVSVNGNSKINYFKNYALASKEGENTDIDTIGGTGYDLSDTQAMDYFYNKLMKDSKIPAERFNTDGGGNITFTSDGFSREEIRFGKFITRYRAIFQEILLKPVLLQVMKNQKMDDESILKTSINLKFNSDNIFEEQKEQELMKMRAEFINDMKDIMIETVGPEGDLIEVPYFSTTYLIRKYMYLNDDDMSLNEQWKKTDKEKMDIAMEDFKKAAEEAAEREAEASGGNAGGGNW